MGFDKFIESDREALKEEIASLEKIIEDNDLLQSLSDELENMPHLSKEIRDFKNNILDQTERINEILKESTISNRPNRYGLYFNSALRSLEVEIKILNDNLSSLEKDDSKEESSNNLTPSNLSTLKPAKKWFKQNVVPKLKKVLAKAWQFLSGLLTPKEWKIKGGVGAPLLGLANTELEITFGL